MAAAIHFCLDRGVRLINLSYSFAATACGDTLVAACSRAAEMGAIVVASQKCGMLCSFPAGLPTVLAVAEDGSLPLGEVKILDLDRGIVGAFGGPVCVAACNGRAAVVQGSSFACAIVTGLIARMREAAPDITFSDALRYLNRSVTQ